MKKRNLKQFFKELWAMSVLVALTLCILLIFFSVYYVTREHPLWMKLGICAICVLYTIVGIILIYKAADKYDKQVTENKRLQELKNQDKYYIDLVDRHVKDTLRTR